MSHHQTHIYEFGPYQLNSAELLLRRDGESVLLQPKIFDLLLVFVAQFGQTRHHRTIPVTVPC